MRLFDTIRSELFKRSFQRAYADAKRKGMVLDDGYPPDFHGNIDEIVDKEKEEENTVNLEELFGEQYKDKGMVFDYEQDDDTCDKQ